MKILITGDWHLSKSFDEDEQRRVLNFILSYHSKVDELIHLGDVFDSRHPFPSEITMLVQFLTKWKKPITIICGNHDLIGQNQSSLDWIPHAFKNVKLYHNSTTVLKGNLNLFLGHFETDESKIGPSNFRLRKNVSATNFRKYDLTFLGHVHKFQMVTPTVIHPGSIFHVDFGEINDNKNILVLDTATKTLNTTKTPCYPMIRIKISKKEDIERLSDISTKTKVLIDLSSLKIDQAVEYQDLILKKFRHHFVLIKILLPLKEDKNIITEQNISKPNLVDLIEKWLKDHEIENRIKEVIINAYRQATTT
ncbi:MAG: metallophosphoesterase family protein [Candidatus Odinarchaeia archaeon]